MVDTKDYQKKTDYSFYESKEAIENCLFYIITDECDLFIKSLKMTTDSDLAKFNLNDINHPIIEHLHDSNFCRQYLLMIIDLMQNGGFNQKGIPNEKISIRNKILQHDGHEFQGSKIIEKLRNVDAKDVFDFVLALKDAIQGSTDNMYLT